MRSAKLLLLKIQKDSNRYPMILYKRDSNADIFLSKLVGKNPCWGPFIVKLQPVIAYKRLRGQLYQKMMPTRRFLHK